jgi:hypothetical protein
MTSQNTGPDPVAVLYDRITQDIFTLQASLRCDRMILPAFPDERGPNAKECWELFESYLATYHWAFERLNESARLHRELLQGQELNKLVFRTRAKQGKQPYIIDAKAYIDKAKLLYLRWIRELTPVEGRRTVKAFLAKVDHCQALWVEYGFSYDEIERLPTLLDNLQTEWALIEVDREPSLKTTEAIKPKSRTKPGPKPKQVEEGFEQEVYEFWKQGLRPRRVATQLSVDVKTVRLYFDRFRHRANPE